MRRRGYREPGQRRAVAAAVREPEAAPYPPEWRVVVEGGRALRLLRAGESRDVPGIEELSIASQDNGALTLEATSNVRVNRRLQGARVHCDLYLAGVRRRMFSGHLRRLRMGNPETGIVATSAMGYAEIVKLGRALQFRGVARELVRKLMRRLPYRAVRIEGLRDTIRREDEAAMMEATGWEQTATVSEALGQVADEVRCEFRDGPNNVGEAFDAPGLGPGGDVAWEWRAEELLEWSVDVPDDELYSDVVVYKPPEEETTDAEGNTVPAAPGWEVRKRVRYPGMPFSPPNGSTLYLNATEEGIASRARGRRRAEREARRIGREGWTFRIVGPLHPDLEKYDVVAVTEEVRDELRGGTWTLEWRCRVETECAWDAKAMTIALGGPARVASERFAYDPPELPDLLLAALSPWVVPSVAGQAPPPPPLYPSEDLLPSGDLYPRG